MPEQHIDYGRLVERALRRVVRDALGLVAERGLPGQHHLYLTFRTDHPGVRLGDELRARYPAEMTIVLQHEFWDLEVRPDGFAVTLTFSDTPYRLEIPFDAVIVFADPSVEFGLQFSLPDGQNEQLDAAPPARASPIPRLGAKAPRASEGGGADVVALDKFRKK